MPNLRYYTRDNPPPVKYTDIGSETYPVYGWEYDDKNRSFQPVKVGEVNPQADIDAVKCETLTEMLRRVPGGSNLEKLKNAGKLGILPIQPDDLQGKVVDLTGMPDNLIDAKEAIAKAKAEEDALPEEVKNAEGKTSIEKIFNYFTAKLEEQKALEAASKEGDKQ